MVVMEKKPTTIAESIKTAAETPRFLKDKNCPLGSATAKPKVLAIQEDGESLDDKLVNATRT